MIMFIRSSGKVAFCSVKNKMFQWKVMVSNTFLYVVFTFMKNIENNFCLIHWDTQDLGKWMTIGSIFRGNKYFLYVIMLLSYR